MHIKQYGGDMCTFLAIWLVIAVPLFIYIGYKFLKDECLLFDRICKECKRGSHQHEFDIQHTDWCITGARWRMQCEDQKNIVKEM